MDKEVPSGTLSTEILMPHLQPFSEVPTLLKSSLGDGWVEVEIQFLFTERRSESRRGLTRAQLSFCLSR